MNFVVGEVYLDIDRKAVRIFRYNGPGSSDESFYATFYHLPSKDSAWMLYNPVAVAAENYTEKTCQLCPEILKIMYVREK